MRKRFINLQQIAIVYNAKGYKAYNNLGVLNEKQKFFRKALNKVQLVATGRNHQGWETRKLKTLKKCIAIKSTSFLLL